MILFHQIEFLKNEVRSKDTTKPKTSDNNDLNNFVSFNCFKVLEENEIDEKENKHDEQEDLISRSVD